MSEVTFAAPLPENASFTIEVPRDLKDNVGRPLANAGAFPLKVATGDTPPLAKFAAAPFGIVESGADSMLPVTLRHVQGDLRDSRGRQGRRSVRVKRVDSDADILSWFARVSRFHERSVTAREAGLPQAEWFTVEDAVNAKGRPVKRRVERFVGNARGLAAERRRRREAARSAAACKAAIRGPSRSSAFRLPLPATTWWRSNRRGSALSLLDRKAPMYVRTGVLVTNLGVHFKRGRESSVDLGDHARQGQARRRRRRRGLRLPLPPDLRGPHRCAGTRPHQHGARRRQPRDCLVDQGYFVTARKAIASGPSQGVVDTSFVFSQWQKGIESWRFNLPTDFQPQPEVRAHTVFDRTLLRAGETVSMKHFVRAETTQGSRVHRCRPSCRRA